MSLTNVSVNGPTVQQLSARLDRMFAAYKLEYGLCVVACVWHVALLCCSFILFAELHTDQVYVFFCRSLVFVQSCLLFVMTREFLRAEHYLLSPLVAFGSELFRASLSGATREYLHQEPSCGRHVLCLLGTWRNECLEYDASTEVYARRLMHVRLINTTSERTKHIVHVFEHRLLVWCILAIVLPISSVLLQIFACAPAIRFHVLRTFFNLQISGNCVSIVVAALAANMVYDLETQKSSSL